MKLQSGLKDNGGKKNLCLDDHGNQWPNILCDAWHLTETELTVQFQKVYFRKKRKNPFWCKTWECDMTKQCSSWVWGQWQKMETHFSDFYPKITCSLTEFSLHITSSNKKEENPHSLSTVLCTDYISLLCQLILFSPPQNNSMPWSLDPLLPLFWLDSITELVF